jgi:hypothetical protein
VGKWRVLEHLEHLETYLECSLQRLSPARGPGVD